MVSIFSLCTICSIPLPPFFVLYPWTCPPFPQRDRSSPDCVQCVQVLGLCSCFSFSFPVSLNFCQLLFLFPYIHTHFCQRVLSWPFVYCGSFLLSAVLISVSEFLFKGREGFLGGRTSCRPVGGRARLELRTSSYIAHIPEHRRTAGFEGWWWFGLLCFQQRPCQDPPLLHACADGWARLLCLQPWPTCQLLTPVSRPWQAGWVLFQVLPFMGSSRPSLLHTLHPFLIYSAFPEVEFCSSLLIFLTVFRWF